MRTVTYTGGNELVLLHCGAEYFPQLVAAFDAATEEIRMETYIFALDDTGEKIKQALIRAAQRGVRVHLVTDWIGTGRHTSNLLKQELGQAGICHRNFNPWFRRGVSRMHRKMCVVDRKRAYLGGLNIIDDLVDDGDPDIRLPAPRWDFAIAITGPLVAVIHRELESQWARIGRLDLASRLERLTAERGAHVSVDGEGAVAALVVRDNLRNRSTIQRAYLQALGHARVSALLVTPYFAPGRKLRRALETAAARGVAVTLLLGVGQFRIQDAVAQSYYPKLMRSGIKIVEYRKTQLHGKVAVIDDEWATVGSSNFDGLSLFVNQEANIVVRDAEFACSLREHIMAGVNSGVEIRLADLQRRGYFRRLLHGSAFILYRSAMRLITLGKFN